MEEHHPIFSRETKRKEGRRFPNPLIKKRFESETSESDIIKPAITKQVGLKEPSYKTRIISSLAAILGFILILLAGHTYCLLLVLAINIMIFKEIITLKQNSQRESKLPYSSLINWYFFGVTELVATYFFLSHRVIMSSTLNVREILEYYEVQIFNNIWNLCFRNSSICSNPKKRAISISIHYVCVDSCNLCASSSSEHNSYSEYIRRYYLVLFTNGFNYNKRFYC